MKKTPGLPSREQILDFISTSDQPAGKREIARAFGLHGADKIALKALLKDMADEGLIDASPGRAFHQAGGVPKVTVLKIVDVDDSGQAFAVPAAWEASAPPPRLRVREKARKGALGVGDRILARTEEAGSGWIAHPLKKLAATAELMLGVLHQEGDVLWLRSVDKRERRDVRVSDAGGAAAGDLVLAEKAGRPPRITARVTERLGDPFEPRSFSLIAIHKHGIPDQFGDGVEEEAALVARLDTGPLGEGGREDLRHLPLLAIDPEDARDHDDAVWAAPDEDPDNAGGFVAAVAIADVGFYVRPGSLLDREARRRGNSVYFPDRVVPMLPEVLSADVCSLKEGEDRASMVCHLQVAPDGKLKSWRFARALVRIRHNLAYEEAQRLVDEDAGDDLTAILKQLWACWRALAKARDAREPLDLDLPERRVVLDEKGRILSVAPRERLDAHRLIEDYMIAANVAAAKALEAKKAPVMYRIHEPPSREKLVALKDYLATFGVSVALGQVVTPATFNRLLARVGDIDQRPQIMEQVLRSQTQAYYGPANVGHFGLSLGSYAHFTSPIRRYADLLVHRALAGAHGLALPRPKLVGGGAVAEIPASTALSTDDQADLARIGEVISRHERRAMEAERETVDRYVAAYLSIKVGEEVDVRITGVQPFGFFATVEGLGGDGLVPASSLGPDWYRYDEAGQRLVSADGDTVYASGQRLKLRLAEANPISGALRFELPDAPRSRDRTGVGERAPRPMKRRGRPANIRHKNR
ncbi:ribonuclease R [Sphingomonas jejuensis]|uniref:Ribonuclease R n=1 Tax=Sphingomonas jejuensis TaxID=904715 RepID=A0ABX0XIK6_9SPHN|nr:VacB/RNase II family 3'-5' exoribonuclease [Sphingomonas jejuensis]NJC33070.1 ribonuclease R [Sphingomonas jejuensis]